jgi:hypothetical protein
MKERFLDFTLAKDVIAETDRKFKRHIVQPEATIITPARNEQVIWQTRSTAAHKPGVRDGRK